MTCSTCTGSAWTKRRCNAKLMASIKAAILFAIVASPETYALMQKILGRFFTVASSSGLPTLKGLLLHALVFGGLSYLLMSIKTRCATCGF